jgi:type IV pilus assembly protein PilC
MPVFQWEGISPRGETVSGEMEAPTRDAVLARLKFQRVQPIPAKVKKKGTGLAREIVFPGFSDRVTGRDLGIFTRQLAAMLKAGLPIMESLSALAEDSSNKRLRITLRQVKEDIEAGATLAASMRKHPAVFDEFFVSMIVAGEVGGVLDRILPRLGSFIEKNTQLKRKIKGAMIYPASIVTVAILVITVLLVYVIPVFAQMFANAGEALPLPTQFVIHMSSFTITYFKYIAGFAIAAVVAFRKFRQTEAGGLFVDRMALEAPVFGDLMRKSAVSRFAHTLATLTTAGMPILDSLDITARTAGNRAVERAILVARASISDGRSLAEPLRRSKLFPRIACQMVAVGEATGALDTMLHNVTELYEAEVDDAVANLTALMEPIMILFLGVVVGGLLVAMYLPIFKLGSVMH